MDEDQILGFVIADLMKKGFTQTEQAFQEELQQNKNTSSADSLVEPDIAKQILAFSNQTEVEQSILEDLRNRVKLSSVALPSVCFYTFLNIRHGLSCSSISHDGSLVAGGFSDSSLKVWDMAKLGQQTVNCKFVVITCLEQYNMSDCVCLEQYNMLMRSYFTGCNSPLINSLVISSFTGVIMTVEIREKIFVQHDFGFW